MVKVGDRVIVGDWDYLPVHVESIEKEEGTDRVILRLNWGEHGKSRVYLHEQNETWRLHSSSSN